MSPMNALHVVSIQVLAYFCGRTRLISLSVANNGATTHTLRITKCHSLPILSIAET